MSKSETTAKPQPGTREHAAVLQDAAYEVIYALDEILDAIHDCMPPDVQRRLGEARGRVNEACGKLDDLEQSS